MADNVWNNSQADNDGNVAANWSLGWVPKLGDTMVFDGNTTNANCNFGSAAGFSCDACRNDNNYTGKVTSARTITIRDVAAIDHEWEQTVAERYLAVDTGDFQLGGNADLHGVGYTYVRVPGAGGGISIFTAGARIHSAYISYVYPNPSCLIASGTYETEFRIDLGYAANRTISLSAGPYGFDGLSLTTSTIGTFTLDLATNNPSVTVTGDLTIDIDSSGGVTLNASSNALTLQGDLINERTGLGSFSISGTQDLTFSGTANQDIDGCGDWWGTVTENKTAGTITLTDTFGCDAFSGTDGDLDLNTRIFYSLGSISFSSGFTIADLAGSVMTALTTFTADNVDLIGSATWDLNVGSAATLHNLTITNCDASGGVEVDATDNCVDGGGNTNVKFVGATLPLINGGLINAGLIGGGLIR